MPESATRLLERIRLGEDSLLELKQVVFAGGKVRGPSRDAIADELASFANAVGGVLVLGVDDESREIVGIPLDRLDQVVGLITEICEDAIDPPLDAVVERLELPDAMGIRRCVVRVSVERSLFVHRGPGGYVRRSGDSKR